MSVHDYYQGNTGMTCPSCGASVEPGESFCSMCGMNLIAFMAMAPAPSAAPASVGTCPHCGAPLEPGDIFCVSCGSPLGNASTYAVPTAAPASTAMTPDLFAYGSGGSNGGGAAPAHRAPDPAAGSANDMADDDDPTVRPQLLMLTYQEARTGCTKTVSVDGQQVTVNIPAGVDVTTKLDIEGLGYFDDMTGQRGPLRLTFFLV